MSLKLDHLHPKAMPEPNSGCWLWLGAIHSHDGYGRVVRSVRGKRHDVTAHRVSWQDNRGDIPPGLSVLHKCDNRLCVNPEHLYLGTAAENVRDRDVGERTSKGEKHYTRSRRGERHHNARLSDADVAAIRADRRPIKEIANVYGVGWRWVEKLRTRNGTRR